jgi:predicted membrane protein
MQADHISEILCIISLTILLLICLIVPFIFVYLSRDLVHWIYSLLAFFIGPFSGYMLYKNVLQKRLVNFLFFDKSLIKNPDNSTNSIFNEKQFAENNIQETKIEKIKNK